MKLKTLLKDFTNCETRIVIKSENQVNGFPSQFSGFNKELIKSIWNGDKLLNTTISFWSVIDKQLIIWVRY